MLIRIILKSFIILTYSLISLFLLVVLYIVIDHLIRTSSYFLKYLKESGNNILFSFCAFIFVFIIIYIFRKEYRENINLFFKHLFILWFCLVMIFHITTISKLIYKFKDELVTYNSMVILRKEMELAKKIGIKTLRESALKDEWNRDFIAYKKPDGSIVLISLGADGILGTPDDIYAGEFTREELAGYGIKIKQ